MRFVLGLGDGDDIDGTGMFWQPGHFQITMVVERQLEKQSVNNKARSTKE